jgi:hypothetical protein
LTSAQLSAYAASLGVSQAQLIQSIPQNLRLLINSMPSDQGSALLQAFLAAQFGQSQVNAYGTTVPSGETMAMPAGVPMLNARPSISASLPQSPILSMNPSPQIASLYQSLEQMLDVGTIDLPTYWAMVQNLLQLATQPGSNPTAPAASPAQLAYLPATQQKNLSYAYA